MKRFITLLILALILLTGSYAQEDPVRVQNQVMQAERAAFERFQGMQLNAENFVNASENFDVNYYRCEWVIDPGIRYISGKITSYFTITKNTSSIVFDLVDSLRVDSVLYRGTKIQFLREPANTVLVNFPVSMQVNQKDSVSIFYQGVPPSGGGFGSFSRTNTRWGKPVIWTLSQPYGAREWWPCKNGLDDKADSIDIIAITPDPHRLSTNGVQQSETVNGLQRITHYKHRYPITSYLVAIAVTDYASFTDYVQLGSINLPITHHVYPENVNYYKNYVFRVIRSMQLFHSVFGDYPFIKERYGHTQFGWGGGMEHQTNSFIVDVWDGLIAHELAHQWFGDKITCGSWQDIWLNEGFAVFLTNFNEENFYPVTQSMNTRRAQINNITSQPDGSVFVTDTTNVSRIFSGRLTYYKGGWILQMLRWKLGDSVLFRAMRNYLKDTAVAYKYARTENLKKQLEAESKQDLTEYFNDWFYGQGYPSYQLQWTPIGSSWVRTVLNQTTSHPSVNFYEMPVQLRFIKGTQEATVVIDHKKSGQADYHNIGFIPDTVLIDPDLRLVSAKNSTAKADDNSTQQNRVDIFPNPIQSQFYIYLRNFSNSSVSVTMHNSLGQLVYSNQRAVSNGSDFIPVPSAHLASGVYWLKVKAGDNVNITKKILK